MSMNCCNLIISKKKIREKCAIICLAILTLSFWHMVRIINSVNLGKFITLIYLKCMHILEIILNRDNEVERVEKEIH